MDFQGCSMVVTGGTRGIGRAISEAFLRQGARVAVIDIDRQPSVTSDWREEKPCLLLHADVSQAGEVEACFREIGRRWGRIDALVLCAGVTERHPLSEMREEAWERVMDVNAKGAYLCARAAIPWMKDSGGSLTMISSIRARKGFANDSAYIASKGAIEAFGRALAIELAPLHIRVNCVAPGAIETDFNRAQLQAPTFRDQVVESIPLSRLGTPEDVSGAVLFLASEQASYITGVTIEVDGGLCTKG